MLFIRHLAPDLSAYPVLNYFATLSKTPLPENPAGVLPCSVVTVGGRRWVKEVVSPLLDPDFAH